MTIGRRAAHCKGPSRQWRYSNYRDILPKMYVMLSPTQIDIRERARATDGSATRLGSVSVAADP
jgi:hypothetical protein